MITVVGGKLTTYRAMAREVVDRAMRELRFRSGDGLAGAEARTDEEPLPGGEAADLTTFRDRGLEIGVLPESVEHLVRHYGTEAAGIYNLGGGDRRLLRRLAATTPGDRGRSAACRPAGAGTDGRGRPGAAAPPVLRARRTRGIPAARRVAELMGREKAWDEARIEHEARRYEEFARR